MCLLNSLYYCSNPFRCNCSFPRIQFINTCAFRNLFMTVSFSPLLPSSRSDYEDITCFCGKPYMGKPMVECSDCLTWMHIKCVGLRKNAIPKDWYCAPCKGKRAARGITTATGRGVAAGGMSAAKKRRLARKNRRMAAAQSSAPATATSAPSSAPAPEAVPDRLAIPEPAKATDLSKSPAPEERNTASPSTPAELQCAEELPPASPESPEPQTTLGGAGSGFSAPAVMVAAS